MELPGLHADGLDRLRPGRRQRGRVQAQRATRPASAQWLADSLRARSCPATPCCQVVTGLGETGAALCRAGVDKLAFTGSTATGKKVMAACAENLTPGAHRGRRQGRAARRRGRRRRGRRRRRRAGGRMSNAGQTCIGIERVYVHERVYDAFLDRAARARPRELHAGTTPTAQLGPMTMPSQLDVIRRHIDDAIARGGQRRRRRRRRGRRAVRPADRPGRRARGLRGDHRGDLRPDASPSPGSRDMDEAVELANATRTASARRVFSKTRGAGARPPAPLRDDRGQLGDLVRRRSRRCRSVASATPASAASTAPTGCKEFTYAKAVTRQRFKPVLDLTTFDRTAEQDEHRRDAAHRPARTRHAAAQGAAPSVGDPARAPSSGLTQPSRASAAAGTPMTSGASWTRCCTSPGPRGTAAVRTTSSSVESSGTRSHP